MIQIPNLCRHSQEAALAQSAFLDLLPKIHQHANIYFRDIVCSSTKADRVADTVALAWLWFLRLTERGKDVFAFSTAFCSLAARAVRSGRRIAGQERVRDVLSATAQRRHGIKIEPLQILGSTPREQISERPCGQQLAHAHEE